MNGFGRGWNFQDTNTPPDQNGATPPTDNAQDKRNFKQRENKKEA